MTQLDPLALDNAINELRAALKANQLERALDILDELHAPDQAELFGELNEEEQAVLLPQLDPADTADLLAELDEETAAELVADLSTEQIIRIVDEMAPDDAADLLNELEEGQAMAVLAGLEDPDEVRPLLLHADTSAGGLMTSDFLALRRRMTAGEALQAIREWQPRSDDFIADLLVVNAQGQLCGLTPLRALLIAEPAAVVMDFMEEEVISVLVGTDQEECAKMMAHYNLLVLPVVDNKHVLLGIITPDDVMSIMEEEATEDMQRFGGAEPLERPYLETPVLTIVRKRVSWLLLLFITESLTGTVLRHFEHELASVVSLSFFIPLLIGTGGNAGSQTTSTVIRSLAIGEVRLRDVWWIFWHEVRSGLILALIMGVLAFGRAEMWGTGTPVALVVAISIFVIVLWANALGSILPLLAVLVKIDPTVVSGPAMSTLVDATGLFIYFSIARILLGL